MDNALKGLLLAAGVMITCLVVGVGFYVFREARQTAVVSAEQLGEFRKNLSESSLMDYDGVIVSGSDVSNLIKKKLNGMKGSSDVPFFIDVVTGKRVRFTEIEHTKKMRDQASEFYVNPYTRFMGEVNRDRDDVIVGIVFTSQ